MKELTEQLVLLNAIVEIELCSPDPIILNFTDVSILHVNAIKYRISALKWIIKVFINKYISCNHFNLTLTCDTSSIYLLIEK